MIHSSEGGHRRLVHLVAGVFGLVVGLWINSGFAILDAPAPPVAVFTASTVVLALALLRGTSPWILVYGAVACFSVIGSAAVGSSWAGVTWLPIIVAVFELSRLSNVFILALSGTLLVVGAPAIVLLQGSDSPAGFSGSPIYFMGFVGAVAAPIWFRLSWKPLLPWWGRLVAASAVLMTALAIWSVLFSGSRASWLALAAGIVITPVARLVFRGPSRLDYRRAVQSMLVVLLLVPAIELGLGAAFLGSIGESRLMLNLSDRVDDTVAETTSSAPNSISTRLAFWRQAAEAMVQRPLGHGLASYSHVNLAYQNEPMLWSGSPHSILALVAVELGVLGLVAVGALVAVALWSAGQSGSPALSALTAATVVMLFDVFSSMPLNALIWWSAAGSAMAGHRQQSVSSRRLSTVAVAVLVVAAGLFSVRFAIPCTEGCDPIVRFGGHPRLVGSPLLHLGENPNDAGWATWKARYPLAFWLSAAYAAASKPSMPDSGLALLRSYPYQSAATYVLVAQAVSSPAVSADVAACGLARFFDGKPIWRDWRSSAAELAALREELQLLAGVAASDEGACERVDVPARSLGFQ